MKSIIQNPLLGALAGVWLESGWNLSGVCLVVCLGRLERPLSRIVAFDPPDVASEAHLE